MKKYLLTTAALFLWLSACLAQVNPALIAREKEELAHASSDTARIRLLLAIGEGYRFSNIDSALYYTDEIISLGQKIKSDELEAMGLSNKGSVILDSGDIPQAYIYMLQSLSAINKSNSESKFAAPVHGVVENRLGNLFMELGEYNTSIQHYRVSISYFASSQPLAVYNGLSNIGNDFELMGQLDSAKSYQQRAYNYIKRDSTGTYDELEGRLGNVERDLHNYSKALRWYRYGAYNALRHTDLRNLSELYLNLGQTFGKLGQHDSSFYYARKTLEVSQRISMKKSEYQAAALLSDLFKTTRQPDSALFYLSLSQKIKDDLFGPAISRRLQRLALNEQQRQQQFQEQNDKLKYHYTIIAIAAGLGVILLVALIIWRNYRKQKSTNMLLKAQKEEIEAQRDTLEKAFTELKTTQTQLIQSEKMASLGELTAGIAHEIQNPLNFVNNFSEVSVELLDEMDEELDKGDIQEAKTIGADLKQNLQKIQHHGKRADFIVKGMLEHSRTNTGEKQLTDMNVLCDEFLKLSYHGLRAKDKSFNAEMVTHFDPKLPKVNVSQQDMGRVMLNLFNNAFYAVNQKAKTAGADYMPEVSVTTSHENGKVTILVKDNGIGIPDAIKEKIFQPFFTTKPTGQGTGLGLSLSYDIVKAHGGEIRVETNERERPPTGQAGTKFIIKLLIA
jgi:two-component system NtrC family sensor kinase